MTVKHTHSEHRDPRVTFIRRSTWQERHSPAKWACTVRVCRLSRREALFQRSSEVAFRLLPSWSNVPNEPRTWAVLHSVRPSAQRTTHGRCRLGPQPEVTSRWNGNRQATSGSSSVGTCLYWHKSDGASSCDGQGNRAATQPVCSPALRADCQSAAGLASPTGRNPIGPLPRPEPARNRPADRASPPPPRKSAPGRQSRRSLPVPAATWRNGWWISDDR